MERKSIEIKAGKKYRIFWREKHHENKIIHILGIFDNDWVAFKYYYGSNWRYEFNNKSYLKLLFEDGILKKI